MTGKAGSVGSGESSSRSKRRPKKASTSGEKTKSIAEAIGEDIILMLEMEIEGTQNWCRSFKDRLIELIRSGQEIPADFCGKIKDSLVSRSYHMNTLLLDFVDRLWDYIESPKQPMGTKLQPA